MSEYEIVVKPSAEQELEAIRVFDRRRIIDGIRSALSHQPNLETKNRKRLESLCPAFEHTPPIWELRIGQFRVFYDIEESEMTVFIRAVRMKEPHQKTEDIVQ